jgi:hypothetical protein
LSLTQKIIERPPTRQIIIKSLLSTGWPCRWAVKHAMWLYRRVQWQSRARSKEDVNDIQITNIIEHNCCPPEGPQAGASKLEKGLLQKGRCSRAFSKAPAGFSFKWSCFSFCWSSVGLKRLCGLSLVRSEADGSFAQYDRKAVLHSLEEQQGSPVQDMLPIRRDLPTAPDANGRDVLAGGTATARVAIHTVWLAH